jgi:hypothetical protein
MGEEETAPELDPILQVLRAILVYGSLTFAAGFVFGILRELALIPALGRSTGKWLEFVIMLGMTIITATYALRQMRTRHPRALLTTGLGGVILLLIFEAGFALYVMQVPVDTYLASFNVLRGELFPWGLAVMAISPIIIQHFRARVS